MNCATGKVPHSYERAEQLSHTSSRRNEQPMQHYRCNVCGMWHVGTTAKKHGPLKVLRTNHEVRFV